MLGSLQCFLSPTKVKVGNWVDKGKFARLNGLVIQFKCFAKRSRVFVHFKRSELCLCSVGSSIRKLVNILSYSGPDFSRSFKPLRPNRLHQREHKHFLQRIRINYPRGRVTFTFTQTSVLSARRWEPRKVLEICAKPEYTQDTVRNVMWACALGLISSEVKSGFSKRPWHVFWFFFPPWKRLRTYALQPNAKSIRSICMTRNP